MSHVNPLLEAEDMPMDFLPGDVLPGHLQGQALAEVASGLRRSPAAVAGLLHRGLKQLRELLEADSPDGDGQQADG